MKKIWLLVAIVLVLSGCTKEKEEYFNPNWPSTKEDFNRQYDDFDKTYLSGAQVISTFKLYENRPISIVVKMSDGTEVTSANKDLINPLDKYLSELVKDETGEIVGIHFTES